VKDAGFESVDWKSVSENATELIGEGWMLVTPGAPERWNTMTASWGGLGRLWDQDVAFVFVRPSRHTYGFMEREEGFTLSFFDESRRKALQICGAKSGREVDKAEAAGITPLPFRVGEARPRVAFAEARLVLSCRKIYSQDPDLGRVLDPSVVSTFYPKGDVHRLYFGAIEGAWRRAAPGSASA
jgi:flavin reductase (DIM6/NTAB) family NADH-FMN oxidoreductase RutF